MPPLNVQRTNDASTISKSSCAVRGFFKDPYIKLFIKRYRNRCPAINHGYFMRHFAVNRVIRDFLSIAGTDSQIIVLGAGFDTLYFNLRDEGYQDVNFIEIDYERVLNKKLKIILETPQLKKHISDPPDQEADDFLILNGDKYKMIGIDMRQTYLLTSVLLQVADCDKPTLFLSECALMYIGAKSSNELIKMAQMYFNRVVFCLFEHITPNDAFGNLMLTHFSEIGAPLYGVVKYPTIESHRERFEKLKFVQFRGVDLQSIYTNCVPDDIKEYICTLDPFDEMEEFFQTISHNFIACASSGFSLERFSLFHEILVEKSSIQRGTLALGEDFIVREEIPIKFHAHRCALLQYRGAPAILVIGGYGELFKGRGKAPKPSLFDLNGQRLSFSVDEGVAKNELLRLFFSASVIGGKVLMFGGRASPIRPSCEVSLLHLRDDGVLSVERISCEGDVPLPCWRFASTLTNGGKCLFINGGLTTVPIVSGRSYSLDCEKWRWTQINLSGDVCGPRMCHTLSEDEGKLYLFGGLHPNHAVSSDLFVIDLSTNHSRLITTQLDGRFSHTSHVYKSKLLICGGINSRGLNAGLGVYDLVSGVAREFDFPIFDGNLSLMIFLHDSHLVETTEGDCSETVIRVLGGGCQCFSFGSHCNMASVDIRINNFIDL